MTVYVHLYSQSQPVMICAVRNTYTKDGLYCVACDITSHVYKFPLQHIFRIIEMGP